MVENKTGGAQGRENTFSLSFPMEKNLGLWIYRMNWMFAINRSHLIT